MIILIDTPLSKQPVEYDEKALLKARQDNANKFLQSEIKAKPNCRILILTMLANYKDSTSIESFLNTWSKHPTLARAIVDLSEGVYVE